MRNKIFKALMLSLVILFSGSIVLTSAASNLKETNAVVDVDLGTSEMFLDESTYSSIGFYFNIELNNRPYDVKEGGQWDDSHLLTSQQNVVRRYIPSTGQITTREYVFFKLDASLCWMSLNDANINDIFFINGTFSDSNGYHLNIKPIFIKIVDKTSSGIKVSCDTPKVSVLSPSCEVEKNIIRAYETTNVSDLNFTVDKGSINVSYSSGSVINNTFVRRLNETVSSHSINAEITYNTFTYNITYSLLVGLHDFKMSFGASISTDGTSSCELKFTASMPIGSYVGSSIYDAKFIIASKDELHGHSLTYENLFGAERVFTFDPLETDKYLLKQSSHVDSSLVFSSGKFIFTGSIKGILQQNYLTQYVGLCYVENGNKDKALALFENNDQLSNTRSPYQIATLAYDNGNQSMYEKFISKIPVQSVNGYIRCFNADLNNSLIITAPISGDLFSEVNAPEVLGMRATIQKHHISGNGNYIDFFYTKDYGTEFDVYAWDIPKLDSTNNFDNEYTASVAQTMKNAGITVAITSGHSYKTIYNDSDVSYFKYMIDAFYKNGIKTAIQIGGSVEDDRHFYESAPDFSMCPGFYGYLEWDEPSISKISSHLSSYATQFNNTYKGTNHKFIINLNPSHAATSIISDSFTNYLQSYCTNVLDRLDVGHRYLSVDNYPFAKNESSLQENTILDMALTTLYGHEYKATTSFCLQSSGWDDTLGEDDSHMRAPSAGEMKMLVYDALCFGFDTISWFTYSANIGHYQDYETNGGKYVTPINKDNSINSDIYSGLQSANARWNEGKTLLKNYSYRGTYVYSRNTSGWYSDAKPFNRILNESTWTMDRGDRYYISNITSLANSLFSSVSSSRSYLIGVYENPQGEQAYVINNYISKTNGSTSITIKMNSDVNVTQNGATQMLSSGTSKSFTINQGSGLIVRKA